MPIHVVVLVGPDRSLAGGLVVAGGAGSVVDEDILGGARHGADTTVRRTRTPFRTRHDVWALTCNDKGHAIRRSS